jgi:hypothetical protein
MYRQGLGDCFLLMLPKKDGQEPFKIMIDCGVLLGTKDQEERMREVVANIVKDTGGEVDLLVVSHEHWDHVSAFVQVQDLFAPAGAPSTQRNGKLSVREVWFAWTEDPNDRLARRLQREREEQIKKLALFAEGAAKRGMAATPLMEGLGHLLGFFGAAKGGTPDAMAFAKRLSNKVRYRRPSDPPDTLPGVEGVRVFVLGPPADEKLIRKTDSKKETYHALFGLGAPLSFFAASEAMATEPEKRSREAWAEIDRHCPFDPRYGRPWTTGRDGGVAAQQTSPAAAASGAPATAAADGDAGSSLAAFLWRHYWGPSTSKSRPEQDWRRIDDTWIGAAAEFALKLDSATNNTSLALAFELVDSKKVLLFVADAQVGNWLSWHDLSWKISDDETVTGPDLLRRTYFYKVGHHGSHNATPKARGLEMMPDDIVAFMPVDRAMAVKKQWLRMPLPGIVSELKRKTRGRLVRVDEDFAVDPVLKGDDQRAAEAFRKQLTKGPNYYEWRMPMPD